MALPTLDEVQVRVLGVLLEKQMSTPEYYPLTLNALVAGCNQSSNRDPVLRLEETTVLDALEALRAEGLVWVVQQAGSRATKYEHRLKERFDLSEQEAAVLGELLLRGPQTPGELRSRTHRMYAFPDLQEVEVALSILQEGEHRLVVKLPRAPGSREARFAQILGGAEDPRATRPLDAAAGAAPSLASLQAEVAALRAEVEDLRARMDRLAPRF